MSRASTRRGLLLTSGAVVAAGAPVVGAAEGHPDAVLITACAEFVALEGKINAIHAPPYDHLPVGEAFALERAREGEAEPFEAQQALLVELICAARPNTPEGHAARARALLAWDKNPCWQDSESWNDRLLGAIVRDLVGEAQA